MSEVELKKIVPFWDKLSKKQKEILTSSAKWKHEEWKKGFRFLSYENIYGCIFIQSGSIGAFLFGENDVETELYRMGRDEVCVADFALTCGKEISDVAFQVLTKTADVVILDKKETERIYDNVPQFEAYLSKSFAEKIPHLFAAIGQRDYFSLEKKIADLLLNESARVRSNELLLTHAQIASRIGSARESVTRKLKEWKELGVVSGERGEITIRNKEFLKKI